MRWQLTRPLHLVLSPVIEHSPSVKSSLLNISLNRKGDQFFLSHSHQAFLVYLREWLILSQVTNSFFIPSCLSHSPSLEPHYYTLTWIGDHLSLSPSRLVSRVAQRMTNIVPRNKLLLHCFLSLTKLKTSLLYITFRSHVLSSLLLRSLVWLGEDDQCCCLLSNKFPWSLPVSLTHQT